MNKKNLNKDNCTKKLTEKAIVLRKISEQLIQFLLSTPVCNTCSGNESCSLADLQLFGCSNLNRCRCVLWLSYKMQRQQKWKTWNAAAARFHIKTGKLQGLPQPLLTQRGGDWWPVLCNLILYLSPLIMWLMVRQPSQHHKYYHSHR